MPDSSANPAVPITITVNDNGTLSVQPEWFIVHKHRDEMVKWSCTQADQYFTVEFGDGSPFYESHFSKDHPCSGLVRRNVEPDKNRGYKYTVRVGDKVLDPEGAVDK